MGATNHTSNYNLSQFVGTDKPAWLQDYNGDMLKIDTGINAAKVAADSAALDASTAQGAADTANQAITNTLTPAVSALQTTVGNQGGAINTITALIGNGTPTTTDQTIIGAINELHSDIQASYTFTSQHRIRVTSDGVKTYAQILEELYASFMSYLSGKDSTYRFRPIEFIDNGNTKYFASDKKSVYDKTFNSSFVGSRSSIGASNWYIDTVTIFTSSIYRNCTSGTVTDISSIVPASDINFDLILDEFEIII